MNDKTRTLYPHQAEGARYMVEREGTLVTSEVGTGKTAMAIEAMRQADVWPALVACPAGLRKNWEREIHMWAPELVVGDDVVVASYDTMPTALSFATVIFDEGHTLKEGGTKRSQAAAKVSKRASYRWILSGTPVVNQVSDLANELEIVGKLDEFGGWHAFTKRYCAGHEGKCVACYGHGYNRINGSQRRCRVCGGSGKAYRFDGASNLAELSQLMSERCMLRHRKRDVLDLPPLRDPEVVDVEITNRLRYEDADADIVAWLQNQGDRKGAIAARKARAAVRMAKLRHLVGEGKVPYATGWIRDFIESTGRKLVVFAHHQIVQEAIVQSLGPLAVPLTGGMSPTGSQAAVNRFQKDDQTRVIVASLMAGSVGHTLTAASDVLMVEMPWTVKDFEQARGRCHRAGQTEAVSTHALRAPDTVDHDVLGKVAEKRAVIDRLEAAGDEIGAMLTEQEAV